MTGRHVLDGAAAVLLDFDGPVCSIFAGVPAPTVAERLRDLLSRRGLSIEPIRGQSDPLEVLRFGASVGSSADVRAVDDALRAAELDAVTVAEPTLDADTVIRHLARSGRLPVIVSNNSRPAILGYLDHHELSTSVAGVVGRPYANPGRMKPNPWPVKQALTIAGVQAVDAVLIGDSVSDVQVARATGMRCIGFANKPTKEKTLRSADAVIQTMSELLA